VKEHCCREKPREACGLLAGREGVVSRAIPLPNVSPSPERAYLADPEYLYRALRDLEERGEEMLAIYHSHPGGPPTPSARDLEQAFWPGVVQLVVSLSGREPEARGYLLPEDRTAAPRPVRVLVIKDRAGQTREKVMIP
jgi:proteasome lid subunit RPN8/RPN11